MDVAEALSFLYQSLDGLAAAVADCSIRFSAVCSEFGKEDCKPEEQRMGKTNLSRQLWEIGHCVKRTTDLIRTITISCELPLPPEPVPALGTQQAWKKQEPGQILAGIGMR